MHRWTHLKAKPTKRPMTTRATAILWIAFVGDLLFQFLTMEAEEWLVLEDGTLIAHHRRHPRRIQWAKNSFQRNISIVQNLRSLAKRKCFLVFQPQKRQSMNGERHMPKRHLAQLRWHQSGLHRYRLLVSSW